MIPIIDLSKYPENTTQLIEACEKWGCFRLINHGVPLKTMSEMKSVVGSILDRPMEIKRRIVGAITSSGYSAPTVANPIYEAMGLYDISEMHVINHFCDQLDCSVHERETIQGYAKSIQDMVKDLATKIAESMGLIGDLFKGWPCEFRINKYDFKPESVGSLGVTLHTDSGFLTLLQDDEIVGGLEVMDKSGKLVAVDPWPGTFLVNLGDTATAWSNGRLRTVKHRVLCNEARLRISIANFIVGPKDGNVEAPEDLLDGEHPRLYKPFNYEYYRNFRISNKMIGGEALALFRA